MIPSVAEKFTVAQLFPKNIYICETIHFFENPFSYPATDTLFFRKTVRHEFFMNIHVFLDLSS